MTARNVAIWIPVLIATLAACAIGFAIGLVFAEALMPGPWERIGPTARAERPGWTIGQLIFAVVFALVPTGVGMLAAMVVRDHWVCRHPSAHPTGGFPR